MLQKFFNLFTLTLLFFLSVSAQNQKEIATLKYNLPEFRDASLWKNRAGLTLFSPDGKYLAITGKSADVVIYETKSGNLLSKIDGKGFRAFSFSPNGKFVVAQDTAEFSMRIFETETGKELRQIRGLGSVSKFSKGMSGTTLINSFEMTSVPISEDWKNILVNKNDQEFAIFDFETGNLKFELPHENNSSSRQLGKILFAGVSAMADEPMIMLMIGGDSTSNFSPDGKTVVIANGNKNPTLWNVENGKLLAKIDAKGRVYFALFSPNSKMVATTDFRGNVKIWDAGTGNYISTVGAKKERVFVTAWSKDSTKVFISSFRKGNVKIFNAASGNFLYSLENSNAVRAILSNNGDYAVTTPRDGKTVYFQIWESESGKLLASIPREKNKEEIRSVKWSPNDQMLVTCAGLKNEVELWNVKGERLQILKNAAFPTQFSSDGKLLLTGGKVSDAQTQNDIGYLWEINNNSFANN